jgi:hypothetical protein
MTPARDDRAQGADLEVDGFRSRALLDALVLVASDVQRCDVAEEFLAESREQMLEILLSFECVSKLPLAQG